MGDLRDFQAIALVSIAFQSVCYIILSRRTGSWFNFASIPMLGDLVLNGLLPYLGMASSPLDGSLFAYAFCQCTYMALAMATVLATMLPPPRLKFLGVLERKRRYSSAVPWLLLAGAILVFSPVLIEFRNYLNDPRGIYVVTRTGYGPIYFLSETFALVAWTSFLFVRQRWSQTIVFFCICSELTYLHGSKGQIVSLGVLYLLYRVYVLGRGITLGQFVPIVLGGGAVLLGSVILFAYNTVDTSNVLDWTISYSNYTEHAMAVIDHPALFQVPRLGRLTFDEEFYSRIPRFILPSKPKDYGEFELAKIYFPDAFESDQGTPAFGVGLRYADFGVLALPIMFFFRIGISWFTLGVIRRVRSSQTPGIFLFLAFLCGIEFIPLGAGYLLPESFLLGLGLNWVFRWWIPLRRNVLGQTRRRLRLA